MADKSFWSYRYDSAVPMQDNVTKQSENVTESRLLVRTENSAPPVYTTAPPVAQEEKTRLGVVNNTQWREETANPELNVDAAKHWQGLGDSLEQRLDTVRPCLEQNDGHRPSVQSTEHSPTQVNDKQQNAVAQEPLPTEADKNMQDVGTLGLTPTSDDHSEDIVMKEEGDSEHSITTLFFVPSLIDESSDIVMEQELAF